VKVYILEKPGKCLDQLLDWLTENGKISEVQTFEDDIEFIDKISICDPGMCIIRAGWNELHGLRVAEMVKQISPEIKIVILSLYYRKRKITQFKRLKLEYMVIYFVQLIKRSLLIRLPQDNNKPPCTRKNPEGGFSYAYF